MGIYIQILARVLVVDVVQFGILFSVVNLAFAGSFLLALKGDNSLDVHEETSSYLGVVFVGLRIMIEASPVVDYTGADGYRWWYAYGGGHGVTCFPMSYGVWSQYLIQLNAPKSEINLMEFSWPVSLTIMLIFLFATIVVLMNILIAQLSSAYTQAQDGALRRLHLNKACIVARIERNDLHLYFRCLFPEPIRKKHYVASAIFAKGEIERMELTEAFNEMHKRRSKAQATD